MNYSEVAGQWTPLTKLARNTLIRIVVIAYAASYTRTDADGRLSARTLYEEFPTFIFGFLALAVFASFSLFSPTQLAAIDTAYSWLFLVAFVGSGTEIQLRELRTT